jgi:large subunit ribosomal protein L18e
MGRSNQQGKTSSELMHTIEELRRISRENGAPMWRAVADRLERPSRNWAEVNLDHASASLAEGETGVVPGRVLGGGSARKGLRLAAYGFSGAAREKMKAAGGSALSLLELAATDPSGSKIRILG